MPNNPAAPPPSNPGGAWRPANRSAASRYVGFLFIGLAQVRHGAHSPISRFHGQWRAVEAKQVFFLFSFESDFGSEGPALPRLNSRSCAEGA